MHADFTIDDVKDFVTLRRWLDSRSPYLNSIDEETNSDFQTKEISIETLDQVQSVNSFPYQSFANLRHWRKAPKSLKIFFQALTCFFALSNQRDFLTELKVNHRFIHTIKTYRPSSIVLDEFRMNYSNLEQLSLDSIRKKSFDAYLVACWIFQFN